MEIFKVFHIEAAHMLPLVPADHKCRRLHGHSYKVEVHIRGEINEGGWIMDFADISEAFEPVFAALDHHYLNEIDGLSNPTSENIARWIWEHLQPSMPELSKIVIHETCTSGCSYSGH